MNFDISDFYFENQYCGLKIENSKILIFFGSLNFENIYTKAFPQYEFSLLKQTHGNAIVETTSVYQKDIEADAQWSNRVNVAHVIQTADCLPIFITDKKFDKISGIHAGWRGIENRITPKILGEIFPNENVNIFTGPHILMDSFEVDVDVKEKLESCTNPRNEEFVFDKEKNKYHIDLKNISKLQILESHKMNFYYHASIDTKTDLRFCSFRRDGKNCGRNISFIVKKQLQPA